MHLSQITVTTVEELDAVLAAADPSARRIASVHVTSGMGASYRLDSQGVSRAVFRHRLESVRRDLLARLPAGASVVTGGQDEDMELLRVLNVILPRRVASQ